MTDWLSEIEEEIEIELEVQMDDAKRMARVIRELASYMLANNALEGVNSGIEPSDIPRLRKLRQRAWNNLSSDATEVLYEMQTRFNLSPDAKGLLTEPDGGK